MKRNVSEIHSDHPTYAMALIKYAERLAVHIYYPLDLFNIKLIINTRISIPSRVCFKYSSI